MDQQIQICEDTDFWSRVKYVKFDAKKYSCATDTSRFSRLDILAVPGRERSVQLADQNVCVCVRCA